MNKDIIKNPFFYLTAIPVLAALWPLVVWSVYIPNADESFQKEKKSYNEAQKKMTEILEIDPDRLNFADAVGSAKKFDYASAVEQITSICKIPSANYKLSSGVIIKKDKQKSQNANIILKDINIEKFAEFLSAIQLRYPNLQCLQLKKLQKKKGAPDLWDVDLEFKYYF
jgi:hypothetical protein